MGWKDILRPIRDGFRDNIPSRKPDDDNETRRRREIREQDALKGFTYLESFEELQQWTPDHVSSIQRSNTPLLPRSDAADVEERNKSSLTIIHDYSGNYHDYEAVQGFSLDQEAYSCEYLQFVDSFVYFSHKLVCVPPPSWTNTLHRNGVKCLGTFLVEPQSSGISNILHRRYSEQTKTWEYTMASQLTRIARDCGFDGWLLNIEKTFALSDWKREDLVGFIQQLRSAFGEGCIIWYDSLTTNNTIRYQNGLTQQNVIFAKAAGSILTNYAWNPQKASDTKMLALQHGIDPRNVICGIDVWAQNSGSEKKGRTTYPQDEGGGTGTGIGVAKLAEIGLSAGIFAPAWPYEHFSTSCKAAERSMWAGDPLPSPLQCDCTPANRHAIQQYRSHPIIKEAREFTAGSENFFYTNFERAFRKHQSGESSDGERLIANIGSQSILPYLATSGTVIRGSDSRECTIFGQLEDTPPRCTVSMHPGSNASARGSLRLFKLRMKGLLTLTVTYRKPETPKDLQIWLIIGGIFMRIPVSNHACTRRVIEQSLDCQEGPGHITSILVEVEGELPMEAIGDTLDLIQLLDICIRPCKRKRDVYKIHDVVFDKRDKGPTRLCWKFSQVVVEGSGSGNEDESIYSELTGPFSYFEIEMEGKEVGRAYALEYLLDTGINSDADVRIMGIGFDGELTCTFEGVAQQIQRQSSVDSWDIV